MSRRDSDSKRHHSRFDRETSPKRYRRDGKQEREGERERDRERERERVTTNGGGRVDRDQRNHLQHYSKQANRDAVDDKKSNYHTEASKHSSDPTQPQRSHYYHQHGERRNAGQVGQSTGQREAGGKAFTQSREQNERVETGRSRELKDDKSHSKLDDKSHSKLDDNLLKRDGFSERKDDRPPTTRRRPPFREKKIPVDSGEVHPAPTLAAKSGLTDHPSERNERKEEKSSNPNHLDRHEKQSADDRLPNRNGGAWRDGFSSRGRYGGSGGNSHYRGREKFYGRQGYQPTATTRTEKWRHDLYQEVNNDPLPKNEDDQIAKLEALLAS